MSGADRVTDAGSVGPAPAAGSLADPRGASAGPAEAAAATPFSREDLVERMLDYEAGWAEAAAACGVIPQEAASRIAGVCRRWRPSLTELDLAARAAGNLAIPLVEALTAAVAAEDADTARHVHVGATSQDVLDTARMLQVRDALVGIAADCGEARAALKTLAARHVATPLLARTLLQPAGITSFGLKVAGWHEGLCQAHAAIRRVATEAVALQFGGACGTLAPLGDTGLAVNAALARRLGLALPRLPWHAQRLRVADLGAALALLIGALGKIGTDIALMAQAEVGELREPWSAGRGGSSALPHKRNPVACAALIATAAHAPAQLAILFAALTQEHERGLGGLQREGDALPWLCRAAADALCWLRELLAGLEVDTARMRANLAVAQDATAAPRLAARLADALGARPAHAQVAALAARARAEGCTLADLARRDPEIRAHCDDATLDAVFALPTVPTAAIALCERALAASDGDGAGGSTTAPPG